MKNKLVLITLMFLIVTVNAGCSVVSGIFNAGVGVGVFLVVVVLAIILFIISKVSGGAK